MRFESRDQTIFHLIKKWELYSHGLEIKNEINLLVFDEFLDVVLLYVLFTHFNFTMLSLPKEKLGTKSSVGESFTIPGFRNFSFEMAIETAMTCTRVKSLF